MIEITPDGVKTVKWTLSRDTKTPQRIARMPFVDVLALIANTRTETEFRRMFWEQADIRGE